MSWCQVYIDIRTQMHHSLIIIVIIIVIVIIIIILVILIITIVTYYCYYHYYYHCCYDYVCVCAPLPLALGGSFLKILRDAKAERILQAAHLHKSLDFTVPGDGR